MDTDHERPRDHELPAGTVHAENDEQAGMAAMPIAAHDKHAGHSVAILPDGPATRILGDRGEQPGREDGSRGGGGYVVTASSEISSARSITAKPSASCSSVMQSGGFVWMELLGVMV